MNQPEDAEPGQLEMLAQVFQTQLVACLEECARGRLGLFSGFEHLGSEGGREAWPETEQLRALALAMQGIFAQSEEPNPLCDEFLDLCTIHGENDPGEPRLARAFLQRIEKGEVGKQAEAEKKLW